MNDVKLISVTPDAEKHMDYCVTKSKQPSNQDNEKVFWSIEVLRKAPALEYF